MRPERHNAVKVLLFFDIGGSMDWHIKATEELFSAARSEFKHMEHFYFHNCLYEKVWKENRRRFQETTPTWDVLHTYPHDYKVVFVGDASMSPLRDHGAGRLGRALQRRAGRRLARARDAHLSGGVWLNPVPEREWDYTHSIKIDAATDGRADVSADAGGARPGDAGVGALASVARMERSGIRGDFVAGPFPDSAALHAGYKLCSVTPTLPGISSPQRSLRKALLRAESIPVILRRGAKRASKDERPRAVAPSRLGAARRAPQGDGRMMGASRRSKSPFRIAAMPLYWPRR